MGHTKCAVALAIVLALGACKLKNKDDIEPPTPCAGSEACTAEGLVCIAGTCQMPGGVMPGGACWATRDCMSGNYCTPLGLCAPSGTGADGDACQSDATCGEGLRCSYEGFFGSCAPGGTAEPGATCTATDECLAGLWCGTEGTCGPLLTAFPPFVGAFCAEDTATPRAFFEVPRPGQAPLDFFRLPFPNDARVNAGALDMADFPKPGPTPLGIDLVGMYVDMMVEDFQGFATTGTTTFRFSKPINFDSTTDRVTMVDLTEARTLALGWSYTDGRTLYNCQNALTVRADLSSPPVGGHTYAAFITTGVTTADGTALARDADFDAVMAAERPADASLGHAWDAYAPFRAWLSTAGRDPATILTATVWTTQDPTALMLELAAAAEAQPAPTLADLTLCGPGVTSPCDDGTPARACGASDGNFDEYHGRITFPIYQQGTAPYLDPTEGAITTTAAPVRTEAVCMSLAVPKGVAPGAGWPLTVYHHGTGGSFRSGIQSGVASALAGSATPTALLSFDAIQHGTRRGSDTTNPDRLVFNPLSPRATRDGFLQGAVDIITALRVAGTTVNLPVRGDTLFDAARTTYFGHSQGSTSGALAVAVSQRAGAVVLSGHGSWLTQSLLTKTNPVNIKDGLALLLGETLSASHPVMTIFQTVLERSDPVNYNPLIVRRPPGGIASKHVYMSYAPGDTYSPPATMEMSARGLGAPSVMPVIDDLESGAAIARPVSLNKAGGDGPQRTVAVFQYQPTGDGHFVSTDVAQAITDWTAFLSSYVATGTPTVP